jgi:hypothetical protein
MVRQESTKLKTNFEGFVLRAKSHDFLYERWHYVGFYMKTTASDSLHVPDERFVLYNPSSMQLCPPLGLNLIFSVICLVFLHLLLRGNLVQAREIGHMSVEFRGVEYATVH